MGLDNFPQSYPCRTRDTAVMVDRLGQDGQPIKDDLGFTMKQIDCGLTQLVGGCPLTADESRPDTGSVVGMLGADCWYRGKYGNHLLSELGLDTNVLYGGDGDHLDEATCSEFADEIQQALNERIADVGSVLIEDDDVTDEVRYLIWWLNWCAKYGDGVGAWY